jgi:hypothetical protein
MSLAVGAANRHAQIGLAYAMIALAAALRETADQST